MALDVPARPRAASEQARAAGFPNVRLRRLRSSPTLRRMVRETRLAVDDLILPLFVDHNVAGPEPIPSMPGVERLTVELAVEEARCASELGIPCVLVFGLPERKDALGSGAYDPDGIVQRAARAIKTACPELVLIGDVCLCEYTSHGHCGVIQDGGVDNDRTLELLAATAVSQAEAGFDVVAPSDMMDGRVGAIRQALDAAGYQDRSIMAYSAKFASGFYGPFREAADSTPQFGDRRSYQMDPANAREAMREIELDVQEGADLVMVKPALAYMDLIAKARARFELPLVAYNVSGEFAMVKAAAANGWIEEKRIVHEILTGIKRAGADLVISYHAKDAARWLREGSF
ncbi:MAG TPA: porphobilinogen synthase [Chloroflexota bacterium]|nr:porphobilinogen synthase [Chloroflexota bacterium]